MQVRYQLRHSPMRAPPPGNAGNLSQGVRRRESGAATRGQVVRRQPQPARAVSASDRPGAVVHRLEAVRRSPGASRGARRGRSAGRRRASTTHGGLAVAERVEDLAQRGHDRGRRPARPSRLRAPRRGRGRPTSRRTRSPIWSRELGQGQAGALAEVVLPQARVLDGGQPGRLLQERRGLPGTGQVTGDEQRPGRTPPRPAPSPRPGHDRCRRGRRRRGPARAPRRSTRSGRAGPGRPTPAGGPAPAPPQRATAGGHVRGQRDHRAVAPEPLERVELALLGVLHVHHDLGVVDQHPAAVALALAAYGLGAGLAQLLLDLVDDRLDLALVGRRAEQEGVGDHELLADVEGQDVLGQLVGGRPRGCVHQLDGVVGGGHAVLQPSSSRGRAWRCTARRRRARGTRPAHPWPGARGTRWRRSPARGSPGSSPGRWGCPRACWGSSRSRAGCSPRSRRARRAPRRRAR